MSHIVTVIRKFDEESNRFEQSNEPSSLYIKFKELLGHHYGIYEHLYDFD